MKYLKNNKWSQISREERFFCSELYYELCHDLLPLLEALKIDVKNKSFDIGFEVCLYRDLLKFNDKRVSKMNFPQKRTFDLVIFSENELYIIEAKCQQGYKSSQLQSIKKEKELIMSLFKEIEHEKLITPILISINSSKYNMSKEIQTVFDYIITWDNIAGIYKNRQEIFKRADGIYLN